MKKLVGFTILSLLFLFCINRVSALSVSSSNVTIDKGGNEKIELYANSDVAISKVEFTLVYSTYDIPANFFVNTNYNDENPNGIKHIVNLGEEKSGKILLGTISVSVIANPTVKGGRVNIHSAKGYTTSGETISLDSQNINITIGIPVNNQDVIIEKDGKEIDKNLLDRIESDLVSVNIEKDVFEYTVYVSNDIEELDLIAVPKNENTKVEISSQKIAEIEDNKIIITASIDDIKQEYVINLSNKSDVEVTIDNSEFRENDSYKGKWVAISLVFGVFLIVGFILTKRSGKV